MNDLDTFLTTWADAERDGDAETTERLLTDDFVGIGPMGYQLSKPAWVHRQTSFIAGTPGAAGERIHAAGGPLAR